MDTKGLLVQGFAREEYESKKGKIKYSYKSETIGSQLLADAQQKSDRGIVRISSGLESFGDTKFDTFDKAVLFVSGLNPSVALKIKRKQDELNVEVDAALAEWAKGVKISELTDEEIITKLMASDRVVLIASDKSVPFTVELQSLNVEEEIRTTEGFTSDNVLTQETADDFRFGVLRYGIKSINGIVFKDPLSQENALKTLPYPMLGILYSWHRTLTDRVKVALEDEGNF